jgi:hypothetical protein
MSSVTVICLGYNNCKITTANIQKAEYFNVISNNVPYLEVV